MILVDTSIWIDYLGRGEPHLRQLLESGAVVIHSWIVGEIALGNLGNRLETLTLLMELPHLPIAPIDAVLGLIDDVPLHGLGIGYVDVQLLTAAYTAIDTQLWTRDRRLLTAARVLQVAYEPTMGSLMGAVDG